MKTLFILLFFSSTIALADTTVRCSSSDFNAENFEGQSLLLTLSGSALAKVEKVEGSWYCDNGQVANPRTIDENSASKKYDVNFGCDEENASLTLSSDTSEHQKPSSVVYSFSDYEMGQMSWELFCE